MRDCISERIERKIKTQKQGLSLPSFHDCQWSCKKGKIVMAPILLAGITTSDQSSCQFGCQFGQSVAYFIFEKSYFVKLNYRII